VLDTGEDATPVSTVECSVSNSSDFHVDTISGKNLVVNISEQVEEATLFSSVGIGVRQNPVFLTQSNAVTPLTWIVLRRLTVHLTLVPLDVRLASLHQFSLKDPA
jgi:hypothetical protein